MNESEKKIVVYDDGCPTCTVGMEYAEKHDSTGRLTFVGMNTEEGKELIQKHGLDMERTAYVLHADGTRAETARFIIDVFAGGSILGFLVSMPFRVPVVGDALYRLLAKHRKHVTKTNIDK